MLWNDTTFELEWNATLGNNLKWNITLGWNGIPHLKMTQKKMRDR